VEANIIDIDGTIDLPENYLKYLDIVWAGLHFPCLPPASRSLNTEALINALHNPFVDGIVHPGNPDYPIDEMAVVQEAIKQGKLLEINNSSFVIRRGSKTRCLEIAKLIHRYDALVALNSDAHIAKYVGTNEKAVLLAVESGISPQQIINTDMHQLKRFLKNRGKRRFLTYE
jgi:putative hydrolase